MLNKRLLNRAGKFIQPTNITCKNLFKKNVYFLSSQQTFLTPTMWWVLRITSRPRPSQACGHFGTWQIHIWNIQQSVIDGVTEAYVKCYRSPGAGVDNTDIMNRHTTMRQEVNTYRWTTSNLEEAKISVIGMIKARFGLILWYFGYDMIYTRSSSFYCDYPSAVS